MTPHSSIPISPRGIKENEEKLKGMNNADVVMEEEEEDKEERSEE